MPYISISIGFSLMEISYESSSDIKQSNISVGILYSVGELSYGSPADIKQSSSSAKIQFSIGQLAYGSFAKDVKSSYINYPAGNQEAYVDLTYNVVLYAFLGKAWLFDGSSLTDFGSPVVAIYPLVATDGSKIIACGGLLEDGTVSGDVYGFGVTMYYLIADRDYLAIIVPTDVVYVLDDTGSIVTSTKQLAVAPFMKNWRLVSRSPFEAIVMKL